MKIDNNISYRNTSLNRKNIRVSRISTPNMANDTVSFRGLSKFDPRNLKKVTPYVRDMIDYAPSMLQVDAKRVTAAMKKASNPQKTLFVTLTENFNGRNFYAPIEKKENPDVIFSLVEKVKFPTMSHIRFASSQRYGVTRIAKCMEKLDYDGSQIKKFSDVSHDLVKTSNGKADDIMTILDSENSAEYLGNYPKYKHYFRRHIQEQDCVTKLDKMVQEGTYDAVKEKKLYDLERTIRGTSLKGVVDVERLAPYSSDESNNLLELFYDKLRADKLQDKTNYSQNLAEIYSTTTKANHEARTAYLNSYMYSQGVHEYHRDEMDNITKLFKRMDEEPEVMSFVKNISLPDSNVVGAGGILKVLDNVSPKKRDLYSKQISSILTSGTENSVDKTIRFCSLQSDSVLGNVKKGIKAYVGSLFKSSKDDFSYKQQRRIIRRTYKKLNVPIADRPAVIGEKPSVPVQVPVSDLQVTKRSGIFVNKPAKQPSAQKLQVVSDVNNLIEKKLGKNTLSDQSKSYARGATKMRLSMLPEIFESIKDTRAQKRAAGTFSKHKSESNADALTLYNMINGRNKRFVNYMLKVRKEDGTRMYSVKDIISTVGETEKSIRTAKYHGTPIPPAEAKAMYTTMLDEQIAQHGKLPRAKKK